MSTNENYAIVLKDLESRHRQCEELIEQKRQEQQTLSSLISNLRSIMPSSQLPLPIRAQHPSYGAVPAHELEISAGKFVGISVRWAILYLLCELSDVPMATSEISKALLNGGMTSSARNFNANVSAVISGMVNGRKEVSLVEGKYQATDLGQDLFHGVQQTPQWIARTRVDG